MSLEPNEAAAALARQIKTAFSCKAGQIHNDPFSELVRQHATNLHNFKGTLHHAYVAGLAKALKEAQITRADIPAQAMQHRAALRDLLEGRFDCEAQPAQKSASKRG